MKAGVITFKFLAYIDYIESCLNYKMQKQVYHKLWLVEQAVKVKNSLVTFCLVAVKLQCLRLFLG